MAAMAAGRRALGGLENANPLVFRRQGERAATPREEDEALPDAIDGREVFDLIRAISDPEHPLSLEELRVVEEGRVQANDADSTVSVAFTPTIPHCSMATLIGLSIKVKLIRSLPERFKVDVHITQGTHASEHAVKNRREGKLRKRRNPVSRLISKGDRMSAAPNAKRVCVCAERLGRSGDGLAACAHLPSLASSRMFSTVNKQLADKERVAAALENSHLLEVVNQCLSGRP